MPEACFHEDGVAFFKVGGALVGGFIDELGSDMVDDFDEDDLDEFDKLLEGLLDE